jgi:hypothetical protein
LHETGKATAPRLRTLWRPPMRAGLTVPSAARASTNAPSATAPSATTGVGVAAAANGRMIVQRIPRRSQRLAPGAPALLAVRTGWVRLGRHAPVDGADRPLLGAGRVHRASLPHRAA